MHRIPLRTLTCALVLYAGVVAPASAAFGITRSGDRIVVDTGAELLFSVNTSNGDLVSMRYRGNEL